MESKKHLSKIFKDYKGFIRSVVVLLLIVMLAFGSTVSWIEGSDEAAAAGEECTVGAGAGVEFLPIGGNISNNAITFKNTATLVDCSSADGKNFYFPTTGSVRKSTETASTTANLVFRKGVEEDINTKYMTEDFVVKSLENPGGEAVKVYIGAESTFTSDSGSLLPYRISFDFNDGTAPVIICPGLVTEDDYRASETVTGITSAGAASKSNSTAYAMSNYYYGKTPLCEIPAGQSKRVTVSVWLEGTDDESANCAGNKINMNMVLSSEDSYMRTITLVDYSPSSWVHNDNSSVFIVDETTGVYYKMTKSADDNITYVGRIPMSFTSIYFQRAGASDTRPGIQSLYNSWSVDEADNLDSSTTYYVIGRGPGPDTSNSIDDKNYGYWVSDSAKGVIDIYFQDTNWKYSSQAKSEPLIHVFKNDVPIKAWPGFRMEQVGGTSSSVYHFIIPADYQIVFNGNKEGYQTGNINPASDFNINASRAGITKVGYVLNSDNTVTKNNTIIPSS